MIGKKSSPYSLAMPSIFCCSTLRYWGSDVFSANSVTSLALSQELLDGIDDGVLVANLAGDQAIFLREELAQVLDERRGAVGAFHLAVSEHVDLRQKLRLQELDAGQSVVHRPVVAVREVKRVDVPLRRWIVVLDHLHAELVGARDHRPAG